MYFRSKISEAERKEIDILEKLSHRHIVKLAGSYTHGQMLSLLLYPVALCDIATVMEDYEICQLSLDESPPSAQKERPQELGLLQEFEYEKDHPDVPFETYTATFCKYEELMILPRIGCIISAVEYLHSQNIRHKDLKSSNILLSQDNLWLTDFGTATDFSESAVSVTDNGERGSHKYMAPEMAAYQPNGPSADIFSFGCVLLEITLPCLARDSKITAALKQCRSQHDKSFQANIEAIQNLMHPELLQDFCWLDEDVSGPVLEMLRKMISRNLGEGPRIQAVYFKFKLISVVEDDLFFASCCRSVLSRKEH